eukprot:5747991-Ditylum_brightwellii.AAC.1
MECPAYSVPVATLAWLASYFFFVVPAMGHSTIFTSGADTSRFWVFLAWSLKLASSTKNVQTPSHP